MTFEEVLPALKEYKAIKRITMDGRIMLMKCKDKKVRLRVWKGEYNYPIKFTYEDIVANDWRIL